MSFATSYLEKHAFFPPLISEPVAQNLGISIVIPCHNEPDLLASLESLWQSQRASCAAEVLVVVNSGQRHGAEIRAQNKTTILEFERWNAGRNDPLLRFHLIDMPDLPHKFAGVGFARKTGMDEAVRRFAQVSRPDGLVAGFDADSFCDSNYLSVLADFFLKNKAANACSLYFEHPLSGKEFSPEIYQAIVLYELYLRYYVQALRYAGFPYAFHTIGSSFAVRAHTYAREGGMNRRKAGEDFYFLHKIIPLGKYAELNETRVIPSPRPSERVPFGTGAAVGKMLGSEQNYEVYNPLAFDVLKDFFAARQELFGANKAEYEKSLAKLPAPLSGFLHEQNFFQDLEKINANSPNLSTFDKRFFDWFTAFRVLKFLNFAHEGFFQKISAGQAANGLLQRLGLGRRGSSEKDLLLFFRDLDRKGFGLK